MKATLILSFVLATCLPPLAAKPIQVFILAGDECVLEQGLIEGKTKKGKPPKTAATLKEVVSSNQKYAFLRNSKGEWVERKDVQLYDAHPVHNNTKAPARPLKIGVIGLTGPEKTPAMGVDLMLGHTLGNAYEEPVLIIRHGTWSHPWFRRGYRSLGHDFRSPSSGGAADLDGGWDIIHFNFGVHDTGYRNPANYSDKDETKFPIYIPLDEYEKNLRIIVSKLKKTGATLIWGRITPVLDETPGWKAIDIDRYNAVADKVMKETGVIINDLYAESMRRGFPKKPNVHSVGPLAPKTTETILAAIKSRKKNTKPLPRVLMIGDSITGSYWGGVKKELDGKAYVCKNPANAGATRFGVENIDDWLKLKHYLLNGEEYLLLVSGVKEAMNNLERVFPGYKGQGAELAGLIWFQGGADGKSPSMATAYEKNLVNLINDLRKDLKHPKLPVVVGAITRSDGQASPDQQKVFDAQMAVGDPERHPEFKGTLRSIDTHPMAYPAKECPGGRDPYKGHAGSYLEIGKAMGEAMLNLHGKAPTP
ncbi:MAG: hypothetical protein KJO79_07470 [Verrucomicrobiae bacterium]|nr:hypothetical protein [Verrucomicrobiae bacterium]NNJ87002.1 hypothetical protein [Akkermansiaceae bacterium]